MSEQLPPIPFAPPSITDDDIAAVVDVMRTGWLSSGGVGRDLEEQLAARLEVPHVVAVSSCTAALEICMRSLRLEPGTRVGVPTWTFVASASAIVSVGAVPVLIDVEPDTLNLSPDGVAKAIDQGLDALMLVHYAGAAVDREVHDLAHEAGLPIVEDAAHALGTTDHRGQVAGGGTVGACYSFYATKNLTSGEGGAIATHDEELARFARSQRLHGLSNDAWDRYRVGGRTEYDLLEPGLKANLPDVLAAMARSQLARFDEMQAHRRHVVERYRAALGGDERLELLRDDPRSADHLFPLLLPEGTDRAAVIAAMAADGIGTGIHFRPLHRFSWYAAHADIGPGGVDVAERLADRALSLPLHATLSDDEVDRIIDALVRALP
jgi:dTDP-4-amino-4,6-dideoxygalactose transaminase